MNKKGFTLVELLVVIVIMGLISFLGFPALMKLMNSNITREFELYGDSMIAGAKLYIQKEGYDLRKDNTSMDQLTDGQFIIPLNTLVDQEYVSKYTPSRSSYSCNQNLGGVKVKLDISSNTYQYTYTLTCKANKENYVIDYEW